MDILNKRKRTALSASGADKAVGRSFFETFAPYYRGLAQTVVLEKVYRAYQPKKYKRTLNLLNSVAFQKETQSKYVLQVSLDPILKLRKPVKGQSFYPMLVIRGIPQIEGYPKRDFYYGQDGWLGTFKKRFKHDFYEHTVKRHLK